jgi:hypothetical protein
VGSGDPRCGRSADDDGATTDHGDVKSKGPGPGPAAWCAWWLTRVLLLVLLFGPEHRVFGDVSYFASSMRRIPHVGVGHVLVEYPMAVVGVLAVPWTASQVVGGVALFGVLFCAAALLADAWYLSRLGRAGGAGSRSAVWVWLCAVPALGTVSYARFDLLPGLLVGCTVLWLADRPRAAALALALATAVKLWPALLIPLLLLGSSRRRAAAWVVLLVGAVAVAATVALAGVGRVLSPLTYQADRGLQVESLAATPAMLARLVARGHYHVFYSHFLAYEVRGAGVPLLLELTTVVPVVLLLALLGAWTVLVRRRALIGPDAVVWMFLAATCGFICSGKVLSPQYLLWLLPVAAAGLTVVQRSRGRLLVWTVGLLLASALTHAVFPWLYRDLIVPGPASPLAVGLLASRNVLLLVLLLEACRQSVRALRREPSPTPLVEVRRP